MTISQCPYCWSVNVYPLFTVNGFTDFKCKNCFKTFSKNTGKGYTDKDQGNAPDKAIKQRRMEIKNQNAKIRH